MMLDPGDHLGPYEIVALLGAGGMGEVYKARDTRLGRDVAIKILPPELAADPDRRARFEREARAISQLSHPHICALHDIGEAVPTNPQDPTPKTSSSVSYLVMEYLEGETLAARLERGALPLAEALRLGGAIASALDTAHRHGIVHRDLKPANVMLARGGAARSGVPQAKLMDFGLARPMALAASALGQTASPTVRRPLTGEGTIVGTLQYMAPEQLEGKEADARTDLWALGCVLYEMATGKPAFAGTSQASLIAAILKEAPRSMAQLQPLTPPALERVVKQCLEKDPEERWQSARDIARELEWLAGSSNVATSSTAGDRRGLRRRLVVGLVAGAVISALSFAAGLWLASRVTTPRPIEAGTVRFTVTAPGSVAVAADATSAAISPDGRRLAFVMVDAARTSRLWIRSLDALAAQPLPGTENALFPFWSPDSRFVAFFAEGKLRKVPVGGGSPEVICDAPNGRGGTWSRDGVIVFAPLPLGPLKRVSSDGGEAVEVARPDLSRREMGLRFPTFLPDGEHFVYVSLPSRPEGFDVYLGALNEKAPRRIMTASSAPIYAEPGFLLFSRGDRLVAQRFDAEQLRLLGDIEPIGDAAPVSLAEGAHLLSASTSGVLAYGAPGVPLTRLVWLDRAGREIEPVSLPPDSYARPYLAPDDRRAIVTKANSPASHDLWLVDLERSVASRLTFDGQVRATASGDSIAVWAPDGGRVMFECGGYDVCLVPTTGVGRPEPFIPAGGAFKDPSGWSPDGKYAVFSQIAEGTQYDLWLLPQQGDRKPVRYLGTPFNEITAAISPDGRWVAYDSDETGTSEIYVRSFPEPGEKHRITTAGGFRAQWSRGGRELLIWTSSGLSNTVGPVYSVDVQTSPAFKAGTPRVLFTPRGDLLGLTATSDLKRFLAAVPVEGSAPASITVILNWQAALKGR